MTKLVLYHCAPSPPSRAALFTVRYMGLEAEVSPLNRTGSKLLNHLSFFSFWSTLGKEHQLVWQGTT